MADNTPQRSQRRTARQRRSLEWNDDKIEQAAQVGPEDADAAVVSWDALGNREARGLLDAVEEDDDALVDDSP